MSGQLPPGTYIRQDQIAEDLGMSATPVREGLLALRGQGFVVLKPRRGFMVGSLSPDDIQDLFYAQAMLASEVIARAVERMTEAELGEVSSLQEQLQEAADSGDLARVDELNHRFHRGLNMAARSPKLVWLLGTAADVAPRRFFSTIPGWVEASVEDHEVILEAIRSGDVPTARDAMHEHIMRAGSLLADHFAAATEGRQPASSG